MSTDSLYSLAIEMLRSTNVYRKDIEDFCYTSGMDEIALTELVAINSNGYDRRTRRGENDKNYAYEIIADSLAQYLADYPSTYSYKQSTKDKFVQWLNNIIGKYEIKNAEIPNTLAVQKNERDTAIVMLKELHDRAGVTKDDLKTKLLFSDLRSVQKNLRKLSPELYEGTDIEKDNVYAPFHIGGQPVVANIESFEIKGDPKTHYRTKNTIHPIVLQENLMQAGTLLQSLCRNYCDYESEISMVIAADVWSQLSDYAKEKIEHFFGAGDRMFQRLIDQLNDVCPNQESCMFRTERQMASDIEMTVGEALMYLEKADGRTGTIDYIGADGNRKTLDQQTVRRICNCESKDQFILKSLDGSEKIINYNDIISIYIDP